MTNDEARQYVERWKAAGPALEKVRREELRNLVHQNKAEQIDSLIAAGLLQLRLTASSGMIEMQKIFSKART